MHARGIEARCGYHDEDGLLMSRLERMPDAAREIAEAWKNAAIAKGLTEIP